MPLCYYQHCFQKESVLEKPGRAKKGAQVIDALSCAKAGLAYEGHWKALFFFFNSFLWKHLVNHDYK